MVLSRDDAKAQANININVLSCSRVSPFVEYVTRTIADGHERLLNNCIHVVVSTFMQPYARTHWRWVSPVYIDINDVNMVFPDKWFN